MCNNNVNIITLVLLYSAVYISVLKFNSTNDNWVITHKFVEKSKIPNFTNK